MDTGVRLSVVAAAVALSCGGIVPASAGEPIAQIACARLAPGTCSETGTDPLPPDTYGSQATDTVPDSSTAEVTDLEPLNDKQFLAGFDSTWDTVVVDHPAYGRITNVVVKRVLTCATVARAAAAQMVATYDESSKPVVQAKDAYAAFLSICIERVVGAQQAAGPGSGPRARTAALPGCTTVMVAVPITMQRIGRTYRLRISGRSRRAAGRPALSVNCRLKGHGRVITVRPRRRGAKLRSLVGPQFRLGFSNHSSYPAGFRATYTFRAR